MPSMDLFNHDDGGIVCYVTREGLKVVIEAPEIARIDPVWFSFSTHGRAPSYDDRQGWA
jgi:hypothetical protein